MKTLSRYFALPVVTAVMALVACDSLEQSGDAGSIERVRFAEYQNYKDFGDYVLHVNGLGTNELPPDVAKAAGIVRSENRGMLNVVVLKKLDAREDQPVAADIRVSAANLAGQLRNIEMRKVLEQEAIYYIGEFSVSNRETLVFDIDVIPENDTRQFAVRFSQEFYTK